MKREKEIYTHLLSKRKAWLKTHKVRQGVSHCLTRRLHRSTIC